MVQHLIEFANRHGSERIVFVYEASGQGYGLYDLLTDQGIECYVLSPTHLPKSQKQKRNKTDAKDAQMLLEKARAHVLAGNELPIVWTPPQALRNDRELVRARLETAEAGTSVIGLGRLPQGRLSLLRAPRDPPGPWLGRWRACSARAPLGRGRGSRGPKPGV